MSMNFITTTFQSIKKRVFINSIVFVFFAVILLVCIPIKAYATTPDQISGLEIWLKADSIIDLNDGDVITTWNDSSTNGNNVTQSNSSLKPTYKINTLNGKPVVRFSTDKLVASSQVFNQNQPSTIFAVLRTNAINRMIPFGNASPEGLNGFWPDFYHPNSNLQTVISPETYPSTGSVSSNSWNYYSFIINNTLQVTYKNGSTFGSSSINIANQGLSASPFVVGSYSSGASNLYFDGDIAEIIIYNQTLTNEDRLLVEEYLNNKYFVDTPIVVFTNPTQQLTVHDQWYDFTIPWIQTSNNIEATVSVGNDVGGVEFILNKDEANEVTIIDLTLPYTASFTSLDKGTYTLDAYALDSNGLTRVDEVNSHDRITDIGIGDIIAIFGDSTIAGHTGNLINDSNDINSCSEAIYKTTDCRNFEQADGDSRNEKWASYAVQLAEKLSDYYGYPVFIINEGWGSSNAYQLLNDTLPQTQIRNRLTALQPNKWFLSHGLNDNGCLYNSSHSWCNPVGYIPTTSQYEIAMQGIINEFKTRYGASNNSIYIPRFSYDTRTNTHSTANNFLDSVENLISNNPGINYGPNIWDYFDNHYRIAGENIMADIVHPKAAGFTQVARLWTIALIKPKNVNISQSDGNVTITWDDLSTFESSISGYKIKYGISSGAYTSTVNVGDVLSSSISGLNSGQTYYFTVSAYDNDNFLINETPDSQEVSIVYDGPPSILFNPSSPDPSANATPSLTGTVEDEMGIVTALQYQMDGTGGSWSNCNANDGAFDEAFENFICSVTTPLSDGSHSMYFRAVDSNGNITRNDSYATDSFLIDTTPPTVPRSLSTISPTSTNMPTLWWIASIDSGAGLGNPAYIVQWCRNPVFSDCNSLIGYTYTNSYTHEYELEEGTWYFRVKATDQLNNASEYSDPSSITIDSTAPSSANQLIQTWSYNADDSSNYTYNNVLVSIDNSGAKPVTGANKITNPSFSSDNSSWNVKAVAPGWVEVPGDSGTYGTSNFLVMKYEPKCATTSDLTTGLTSPDTGYNTYNYSTTACTAANNRAVVSVASGYPIANINQTEAASGCSAITLGSTSAHLISNTEWMTIARNAEAQTANWSGGSVGSGYLFAGHNDNQPARALRASTTDTGNNACAYTDSAGTTEAPASCPTNTTNNTSGTAGNQKRVMRLSNGSYVWDIAGNVDEWNSNTITAANQPDVTGQNGLAFREFTALTGYGNLSYDLLRPFNDAFNSSYGMGRIYHNSNSIVTTSNAFIRGGYFSDAVNSGVYTLLLHSTTSTRNYNIGFRCASDPVAISQSHSSSSRTGGGNTISVGTVADAAVTQSINVGATDSLDFSVYVYDTTAGSEGGAVSNSIAQLYYDGAVVSTTYTNVGSGWWKLSGTITGANESREYGVLVKQGKTVKLDDFTLAKASTYSVYTTSAYTNIAVNSWDSFTASVTASGNASVKYQICNDDGSTCESGNSWKYYDGDSWETASNSTTHVNTASELTESVMQALPVDSQKIAVKAIMAFGGSDLPIINSITIGLTGDTTRPTVSSITTVTTPSIATITWSTDENSSSKIDYGLTSSYGSTTSEADTSPRVTSHSVAVSSLRPCTIYHYRVRSKDAATNERVGSDNTFTTSGCTGSSSVQASDTQSITTASGGSVDLIETGTGIALTVPAGFAGSDANFQIKRLDKTATLNTTSTPNTYSLVGNYIYDMKALSGVNTLISNFDEDLTVTMTYTSADITGLDESTLKIYRWDGASWGALSNCSVNTTAKTVTCTTTAFSVFGLFGQASASSGSSTSSGSNGNSSNSSSSSGPKECTGQKPGGTPEVFQIDRNGSVATLHVTPGGDPYNSFFVSYGVGGNTGQYAEYFQYQKATGVMLHEVRDLDPNTTYSFRVQPMNGCMSGEWSNTLAAGAKNGKYFKYGATQLGVRTKSVAATVRNLVAPKKATTGTTDTTATESTNSGTTTTQPSTAPAATTKVTQPTPAPEPTNSGGIWGWVKGLFK